MVTKKTILWLFLFFSSVMNFIFLYGDISGNHYPFFNIWLIDLVLFLYLTGVFVEIGGLHISKFFRTKEFLIVLTILIVSILFRASYLRIAPGNVGGDEMVQAVNAWDFARGKSADLFGVNWWYSTPNLYYFITGPMFSLFGRNVWSWRLTSVIFGTATVILTYFLFSLLFGKKVGIISSFILSGYHLHINFSRIGAHQITDAFWLTLIFLCLFTAIKKKNAFYWGFTGILLAISQNFYFGARILPFLVAGVMVWHFWFGVKKQRLNLLLKAALVIIAGFIVGFYPFLARYAENPSSYTSRLNQIIALDLRGSLQNQKLEYQPWFEENMLINSQKTLSAFISSSSTGWYQPVYPLVNEIALPFFVLGIFVSATNIKRKEYFFILFSFALTLFIVGVLLENPPASQRLVIDAPIIAGLIAIGLSKIHDFVKPHSKILAKTTSIVIVILIILLDLFDYFILYIPERTYGRGNTVRATELSNYLHYKPEGTEYYFLGSWEMAYDSFSNMKFVAPQVSEYDYDSVNVVDFDTDKVLFVAVPERLNDFKEIVDKSKVSGNILALSYFKPEKLGSRLHYYFGRNSFKWVHLKSLDNVNFESSYFLYIYDLTI
jgi:4-amino-4-deoxy-L-arabinose transferase-like glycosyltransferase